MFLRLFFPLILFLGNPTHYITVKLLRNNVTRTCLHLLCYLFCEKNCFILVGVHKPHTAKFCTLVPNILSIIFAVPPPASKNLYQVTSTEQKVPGTSYVHKSHQNCGSTLWNLLYVTCLPPRIWRWLLQF